MFLLYQITIVAFQLSYQIGPLFPIHFSLFGRSWSVSLLKLEVPLPSESVKFYIYAGYNDIGKLFKNLHIKILCSLNYVFHTYNFRNGCGDKESKNFSWFYYFIMLEKQKYLKKIESRILKLTSCAANLEIDVCPCCLYFCSCLFFNSH